MKMNFFLIAVTVVVACIASVGHSFEASTEINYPTKAPKECFKNITICIFYPKVENPHIYDGLKSGEEFSDSRPMTKYSSRPSHYFNDWVAEPNDLRSGSQRVRIYHLWSPVTAWIERKDIVTFSELKPIKQCWPIKYMEIDNGDAPPGSIEFKPDGSGVLVNESTGTKPHNVKVWYAEGVYSVRTVSPRTKYFNRESYEDAWGNIDYKNGLAIHRANWISNSPDRKFEGFAEKDPSCQSGPVVQ